MQEDPSATAQPPATGRPLAVLLGASNLTRGLPAAVAAARQRLGGGPFDALVAAGHGRSYGARSRVLVRGLPGILGCGLWDELDRRAESAGRPQLALLADVGNDIGYGHAPETIAGWVDACTARLAAAGVRGVIARLPLASLHGLPSWRLRLATRLFFPAQRLSPRRLLERAERLEALLDSVAEGHGFARAGLGASWYGPDGIHVWRWKLLAAWDRLLDGAGPPDSGSPPAAPRLADRWQISITGPQRYELCGIERSGRTSCRLGDGSSLRLF